MWKSRVAISSFATSVFMVLLMLVAPASANHLGLSCNTTLAPAGASIFCSTAATQPVPSQWYQDSNHISACDSQRICTLTMPNSNPSIIEACDSSSGDACTHGTSCPDTTGTSNCWRVILCTGSGCSSGIGGQTVPMNKLALLSPYFGVASLVAAGSVLAAFAYLRRAKAEKTK